MSNPTIQLTDQQQAIIAAAQTGESIIVDAGAGAAKTTTSREICKALPSKRILYVGFNKTTADEAAASFPENAECRTTSAVANRALRQAGRTKLVNRLNNDRYMKSAEKAALLGIPQSGHQIDDQQIPAWMIVNSAIDAVKRFCYSADDQITEYHVPKLDGVEDQVAYKSFVLPFARKAWADLSSESGRLPWNKDHSYYIKAWALTNPRLNYDTIIIDEAQDTNPVTIKVFTAQSAQIIMVGDTNQQIYAWRGAVDALKTFKAVHRLQLSKSFRFGQVIANEGNKPLRLLESSMIIEGFEQIDSTVESLTDPDAILCRTNAGVLRHAMEELAKGKKVAVVGGMKEIQKFAEGARDLQSGRRPSHREMAMFKTWGEFTEYVKEEGEGQTKMMVKMIQDYGIAEILSVCEQSTASETNADVIISTAHKAKGREWNRVKIGSDFKAPEEEGTLPAPSELNLIYVAVTRAKLVLDNLALAWLDSLIG